MLYNVWIIKSSGEMAHTTQLLAPNLLQLQRAVGGYIEPVPGFTTLDGHTRGTAFCNEDGISKGLPINSLATEHWRKAAPDGDPQRMTLRGDVVFYNKVRETKNAT